MRLILNDAVHIENKLYMFPKYMNALYVADLKSGSAAFLGNLPEKDYGAKRLVSKIMSWENELYFIPLEAEDIWIYSLKQKNWEKISIKKYQNDNLGANLMHAIIYNNTMFVFGGKYPAILKIDLATKEIVYITKPFEHFTGKPLQIENLLYLASSIDNSVLQFNMDTLDFQWIEEGNQEDRDSDIEKQEYSFFRNDDGKCIYQTLDGLVHYIDDDGVYKIYENEIEENAVRTLFNQIDRKSIETNQSVEIEGKPLSCKLWLELLFDM